MNEPALDLSEIVGMYKEDARRSVTQMRAALERWEEVGQDGPACQELRKLAQPLLETGAVCEFSVHCQDGTWSL